MIYVFKTSVRTRLQAKALAPHIDNLLPAAKWNFDLDDCDKILRIDSEEDVVRKITGLLKWHKFDCEELE
ncbi:hypothetical protein [Flavisolibacter nicotianae]|uniref:hypothetical protein n=1 Tax=Flavisolibacter nicotianae TaxID=2364882 RepID=UPI000EAFE42F|nr:hypothetical protein [Flavisolibacter nicotianae]